ncbi:hypothetical protein [Aestuariivirga sp.]|uniref:hypothetical protein n=1 Tax=Aestuariivirga sp. TaxID=2650926 RepID=UPI0035ADC9A4
MNTNAATSEPAGIAVPREARDRDRRYLFGPFVDFFCLGGVSLLIMPLLLLVPASRYELQFSAFMLLLANFINHPHFAHSYQLFYRGFRSKAFTRELGAGMQARYLFSGIGVPILLAAFFAYCILRGDVKLLGQGGNVMALFVGWHYVKQGYGMLMLDAALKRNFFRETDKKILLVNSYAVWIAAWLGANAYVSSRQMAGLQFYTFDFPQWFVVAAELAALATSAAAAWAIFQHWRSSGSLLVNGVMAYAVSLYAWLLFVRFNPLWIIVVPALHSLQYLIVVWRFELNVGRSEVAHAHTGSTSVLARLLGSELAAHLVLFAVGGLSLGFIGFWGLPMLLNTYMPYDQALFGGALFVFVFWIFINVHHYFIDNVMWRRENPDTRRFLFG